jgi:hypothetical protein
VGVRHEPSEHGARLSRAGLAARLFPALPEGACELYCWLHGASMALYTTSSVARPIIQVVRQVFAQLLLAYLFLLVTTLCADAQQGRLFGGSAKIGKDACTFQDVPTIEERSYATFRQDEQFNLLRNLRSRLADLLPKQRAKDEAARFNADKLRLEKDNLDEKEITAKIDYVTRSLADLDQRITATTDRVNSAGLSQDDKKSAQQDLNSLQNDKQLAQRSLGELKQNLERATRTLPQQLSEADTISQQENSCYLYLQDLNNNVEQKTIELLLPASQKNNFKLWLSAIYAGIVFVVIIGFYGLAYRDKELSGTIFSHQSGLQFITLFSLVIAIILFGILEILEGKELAALLGGISGYILGRVATDRPAMPPAAQRTLSGTTIGFTAPNQITDTANGLGVFSVGDRIQVSGTANNNRTFTAASVSPGSIQTRETTAQTEAAGPSVHIRTI